MTRRHKVFLSYHHENDENYRELFEQYFEDIYVSKTVDYGEIDPNANTDRIAQIIRDDHLRDTSVTVVLVGNKTWKRKHIDWEIYSSLRKTTRSPRSGLIGIILPTYKSPATAKFTRHTIPPRLWDNIECKYAKIYGWIKDESKIENMIHNAFLRREKIQPKNSRPLFRKNRSGDKWQE
jgi:hypothetical protein